MSICVVASCRTHEDADPGAYACSACQLHLTRQLSDIESYLVIVSPVPGRNGPAVRSKGFSSTPPLRLDIVAMLDPRTELNGFGPDDVLDEVPNVRADLWGWVFVLMDEDRGEMPPEPPSSWVTVAFAVTLRTNIGQICRQPWVEGFALDIARVHGALAAVCGDQPAKSYGQCTRAACEGLVYRRSDDPTDGRLRCGSCGTTYSGLDLVKIRTGS